MRRKKRRQEIVEHTEAKIAKKANAVTKRKAKAAEAAQRIAGIKLILDRNEVVKLKGQSLKDHLKAFQMAGAQSVQNLSQSAKVDIIRKGLQQAVDDYLAGKWKPLQPEEMDGSDESESGEDFDIPEDLRRDE